MGELNLLKQGWTVDKIVNVIQHLVDDFEVEIEEL
jgi:hypothetical protein